MTNRPSRTLSGIALGFGLLLLLWRHTPRSVELQRMQVTPARYLRSQLEEEPPPFSLSIDATHTVPEDARALTALRAALPSHTVATTALADDPAWFRWGRLKSPCAAVTSPAPLPEDKLRIYAVHSAEGATVCLINQTQQKVRFRLQLRLPAGVYKCERLAFTPPADSDRVALQAVMGHDVAPAAASLTEALETLESVRLFHTGMLEKPGSLEPGQRCLYRCTDVARAARVAYYDTLDRLHVMAGSTPGPAHHLQHILDEGAAYLSGIGAGHSGSAEKQLGCIHRLLLVTAQAHSVHHNLQGRHAVDAENGAAVLDALDRLTASLSETSAALLGLVPQIALQPDPPTAGESGDSHRATVMLALANDGARSVDMVKIGMNTLALPAGVTCDPEDPAFFGALRPGQTARAIFHLRFPTLTAIPSDRCLGDISYFLSGAPAHLRPRAW